ncbi:MAG TPA: WD40 repeat domain-containing protein [Candidatus Acidoferrales bacterium]|nr:WD40 repeat domain-containing protein [Candidatus Acidoferrales bacterium]
MARTPIAQEANPKRPPAVELARTGSRGLAVRSAALIRRGLRDLARDSNWLIRKVFQGPVTQAAVSPDGQVCTLSPQVRHGAHSLTLFDVERCVPTLTLSLTAEADELDDADAPARFAWSPDGQHLLRARGSRASELQLFDLRAKMLAGAFGSFAHTPSCIAWSPSGTFVASACRGWSASLDLWQMQLRRSPGSAVATRVQQLGVPDWLEPRSTDGESSEAGRFSGYGRMMFSPNERHIAATVEIGGEWADDLIVFLDAATLQKKSAFEAQGRITDLSWSNDGQRLVYCSAGQAYGIDPLSAESSVLPFGGEQCAWHPHLPICLFYSSLLRSSAKGRLFLVDMNRINVFDEYPAEGVLNLRWSVDGSKAYAITNDGLAYIYEPELL